VEAAGHLSAKTALQRRPAKKQIKAPSRSQEPEKLRNNPDATDLLSMLRTILQAEHYVHMYCEYGESRRIFRGRPHKVLTGKSDMCIRGGSSMKLSRINSLLALLAVLTCSFLLLACSENMAPVAVGYNKSYQPKIQAVEHWRSLAGDVADRVLVAIEDRPDLREKPIFVSLPNNRAFSVAFYNLLRTELVSRGLQVAHNRETQGIVVEYAVQAVLFDSARFGAVMDSMGIYRDGDGITPSNNELIVNARMFFQNRFVLHVSAVRYINDADLPLYFDPQAADPMAESSRNVRMINR
jgi:hypothetical protein